MSETLPTTVCTAAWLGRLEFDAAHELQLELARRRAGGLSGDRLLMLEHPPTITLGRSARPENVLAAEGELAARGITVRRTDRGGDVTFHMPGQLVGYPIVSLREMRLDIGGYMDRLEEVLLRALAGYGVAGAREAAHPGVWYGGEQLAAIGLGVKHGVALHGFALNVDPNLADFALINPCGSGRGVTSLAWITGQAPPLPDVAWTLAAHFGQVFGMRVIWDKTPLRV